MNRFSTGGRCGAPRWMRTRPMDASGGFRWLGLPLAICCLAVLALAGCGLKTGPVGTSVDVEQSVVAGETSEGLWAQADDLIGADKPNKAIAVLRQLADRYADHYLAPSALMKIGTLYQSQENPESARDVFSELIDRYPDSFLVTDARVQVLATYYAQGEFEELIADADRLLAAPVGDANRLTVLGLLGDTHLAMDDTASAGRAYAQGAALAEGPTRDLFAEKLSLVISMLAPSQYESFKGQFPETSDAWLVVDRMGKSLMYTRMAIGCVLPLSGRYEAIGQQALEGVELALSRFLTEHPDAEIQLMVRDSQGKPAVAAQMVSELARQGAAAIIGPLVTAAQGAVAAQRERVPILVLTQKQGVTELGDYVFRNFLTPDGQSASLMAYARDQLAGQRFAVIYPDEPYGVLFLNRFWEAVADAGGQVVGVEAYQVTQMDFAKNIKRLAGLAPAVPERFLQAPKQVAELLASGDVDTKLSAAMLPGRSIVGLYRGLPDQFDAAPRKAPRVLPGPVRLSDRKHADADEAVAIADFDAVFIPDAPSKAGLIIPQLAYFDVVDPVLFGTNLWHSSALIEMSRDYVQGAVFPDGFFADSKRPQVQQFVQAFTRVYDRVPGFIEAVSFDSARLIMSLVVREDIRSRDQLRDAILAVSDYDGVTGTTAFHGSGEAHKTPFLLTISQSQIREAAMVSEPPASDNTDSERP